MLAVLSPAGPYREAMERIVAAMKGAPAELEAAPAPEGRGTEPEAIGLPEERGTGLEAMACPVTAERQRSAGQGEH